MISFNRRTRWLHDMPGNTLDLCLVDNTEVIKDIDIITRLGNSDHLCLEIVLIFPISKDNILRTISLAISYVSHLFVLIFVQYGIVYLMI